MGPGRRGLRQGEHRWRNQDGGGKGGAAGHFGLVLSQQHYQPDWGFINALAEVVHQAWVLYREQVPACAFPSVQEGDIRPFPQDSLQPCRPAPRKQKQNQDIWHKPTGNQRGQQQDYLNPGPDLDRQAQHKILRGSQAEKLPDAQP